MRQMDFKHKKGNPYNNGSRFDSSGGSSWSETSWDYYFKTYVQTSGIYSSFGTLESQAFDSGQTSSWQSLEWDEAVSSNTDITLEVATSNDGTTWSGWQLTSSSSPIDLTGLSPSRYIKWRAILTTSDNSQTPILHEVRVNYSQGGTGDIVINEFLPDPLGDECGLSGLEGEWVEIYNKGTIPVDLNNWKVKNEAGTTITISSSNTHTGSTTIGAQGSGSEWLVVFMQGCIFNNDGDGDTVYLYDNNDQLIDSYSYTGPTQENKSYARYPDGTENWYDPVPTPGAPNRLDDEEIQEFAELESQEDDIKLEQNELLEKEPLDKEVPSAEDEEMPVTEESPVDENEPAEEIKGTEEEPTGQEPDTEEGLVDKEEPVEEEPATEQEETGEKADENDEETTDEVVADESDGTTKEEGEGESANEPAGETISEPEALTEDKTSESEVLTDKESPAIVPDNDSSNQGGAEQGSGDGGNDGGSSNVGTSLSETSETNTPGGVGNGGGIGDGGEGGNIGSSASE